MATTIKYVGTEPRLCGYGIITGATELFPGDTFKVRDDVVSSYTCQPSLFEVVEPVAPPAPTGPNPVAELNQEIADLEAQRAALENQEANS